MVALAPYEALNSHMWGVATPEHHRARTFPSSQNILLGSLFLKGSPGSSTENRTPQSMEAAGRTTRRLLTTDGGLRDQSKQGEGTVT